MIRSRLLQPTISLLSIWNLTIPAGASSLTLELQPVDDDLPEGIEHFSVSIAESGNYHASPDSVVISIIDNDDPAILLDDPFEYANGPTVGAPGSPWQNHSGGEGEANLLDGYLELTSSGSESEDINAQLLGAPYPQDEPAILYAGFDVIVDALPSAGGNLLRALHRWNEFAAAAVSSFFAKVPLTGCIVSPSRMRRAIQPKPWFIHRIWNQEWSIGR